MPDILPRVKDRCRLKTYGEKVELEKVWDNPVFQRLVAKGYYRLLTTFYVWTDWGKEVATGPSSEPERLKKEGRQERIIPYGPGAGKKY